MFAAYHQIEIQHQSGVTFAVVAALASCVRIPMSFCVGEIATPKRAQMAIQCRPDGPPGSGHATRQQQYGPLVRLRDLNIKPLLISSALSGG